jgi:hypothetical protein
MKKGATPTNYKTVVQQRLIQDIFKTPHQQDDEDIGSVAVGKELGGGTNLMMGGLLND